MNYPLKRRKPVLTLQETFLRLAQMTTPHGYESYCWSMLPLAGEHPYHIDEYDNVHIFVYNPDGTESRVLWSSHLDTACSVPELVTFRRTKGGKISTDGKTILGADCKIGAAIMIKMIEANIPGWYIFHAGEERGLVGSTAHAKTFKQWPWSPEIAIAFDRKDRFEIITHQGGKRTASDAFAAALAVVFNHDSGLEYKASSDGVYTDTQAYEAIVKECTNIGVGYFRQHSHEECQDMDHAEKLLAAILAHPHHFETLPAPRDPQKDNESKWATVSTYTYTKKSTVNQYGRHVDGKWTNWKTGEYAEYLAERERGIAEGTPPKASGSAVTSPHGVRFGKKMYCMDCGTEDDGCMWCPSCYGRSFSTAPPPQHLLPLPAAPKAASPTKDVPPVWYCANCERVELTEDTDMRESVQCASCFREMEYRLACPHPDTYVDGEKDLKCCYCDHNCDDVKPPTGTASTPSLRIVPQAIMTESEVGEEEDKGAEMDKGYSAMVQWRELQADTRPRLHKIGKARKKNKLGALADLKTTSDEKDKQVLDRLPVVGSDGGYPEYCG